MRDRVPIFLIVVALLLCTALPATAQTTSGRIRGTVVDPDDNPIPGVTISISSTALPGGPRTAVTGETGDFRFASLSPGTYTVMTQMDGFENQSIEGLQVSIGSTATANFTLNAAFEEAVVIHASPLVDLSSSSISTEYSSEFIKDLPTNRNFYDMISVSPGVSLAAEDSDRQISFGSDVQANSWNIDGIETKAPETGTGWIYVNPDMIDEIQVLGIGASAEYGNLQGAAFNVVTKSGTDDFHGAANIYWFDDDLVDSDLGFEESEFSEYHQDNFQDFTATLGGPVWRENIWFFAAYEYWRDNHTFPGSDPATNPEQYSDRYDLKLTGKINDSNSLELKYHYDDWGFPAPASEFATPSASAGEIGDNAAWGFSWESILSNRTYLEARYSGWEANDDWLSQTGSQEAAFIDYTPTGGGPPTYSGGVWWPWQYDTSTDQISLTVSHFADDFLKGDHDFKFGVTANDGDAVTLISPSATGNYYYHYLYEYDYYGYVYEYDYFVKVSGQPYYYGNEQESWGAFVDDSWAVNDRLTINLGIRYDYNKGVTPAFPRPQTGEVVPGIDPVFEWKKWSPRFGFAYNAGADRKTVVRGSVGLYYNGNVGGNWNSPPPQAPLLEAYASLSGPDGPFDIFWWDFSGGVNNVDPNLEPPKTWQYALGFEHEIKSIYSVGLMGVYKDSSNGIGWEFLDDAVYSSFEFTDEVTGGQYTLWEVEQFPTTRKGNKPGYTAAGYLGDYWQEYWALVATFNRRFSGRWDMRANYTYQSSEGLNPRSLHQWQNNPLYGSKEGSHPNQWFNVDGADQLGNRPHMLRVQSNVELPWELILSGSMNLQSGRPYFRQTRAPYSTTASRQDYFATEQLDHPSQALIDLSLGKRFALPGDGQFKIDVQIFNLLNDDATDWFESLIVGPGESFRPNTWVKPRRLMLRLGIEY